MTLSPSESPRPSSEIVLFSTDTERVNGMIERSRSIAGRVLWMCSSKDAMWDTKRRCLRLGYSAQALQHVPLSVESGVTLATYTYVKSILKNQHEKTILAPSDYETCIFDGIEDIPPSCVRELLDELQLPPIFAGLELMSKAELAFYDDFDLPDTSTAIGYSPTRWGGKPSSVGWDAEMRCYGAVKSTTNTSSEYLKEFCSSCPVKDECLEWCLEAERTTQQYEMGYAAGMTATQRGRVRTLLDEGCEREAAAMVAFARSRTY